MEDRAGNNSLKRISGKKLIIALLIMVSSAFYLSSFSRNKRLGATAESVNSGIYSWVINMVNLQEIASGFLWIQFNNDSMNMLANYHRLLVTLDTIVSIVPDDFAAWSLKNFMRLDHGNKKPDPEMRKRAINDYKLSCKINSDDWRFFHDAAQAFYFRAKDLDLALEYAEKAFLLKDHPLKTDALYAKVLEEKGYLNKALKVHQSILKRSDIGESNRKIAQNNIERISKDLKNN